MSKQQIAKATLPEFTQVMNEIWNKTDRVAAILTLVYKNLICAGSDLLSQGKLIACIGQCVDLVPDSINDFFEELENINIKNETTIRVLEKKLQDGIEMHKIFSQAMAAILTPLPRAENLKQHGKALCQIAKRTDELHEQFNMWIAIVKLRGFDVTYEVNEEVTYFELHEK